MRVRLGLLTAEHILAFIVAGTLGSASAKALTADNLKRIDQGFQIFTTETFGGNGRSCGTCHIPDKNYNISPADIAELTDEQKALVFATSVPELENATLVEKLALFNINEGHAPGNDNTPAGPFRGSMTVAGLAFTTANQFCTVPAGGLVALTQCGSFAVTPTERANEPVNDGTRRIELGWAGDGGAGLDPSIFPNIPASQDCIDAVNAFAANPTDRTQALRAFSLGAVRTHNPRSLDRVPGTDFRCPTADELDALAAFQQWLGRRFELDLTKLTFMKGPDENGPGPGLAEEGKAIFMSDIATCNRCHFNAGSNGSLGRVLQPNFGADDPHPPPPAPTVPGANKNSHTSTDILRIAEVILDDLVQPVTIPRDAGDKRERGGVQADGQRAGGFNIQALIEAPRKRGFFHNNGFTTSVEDAASFYFTPTFDASQGGSGRVAAIRYCAVPGNLCPNAPDKLLSGADALAALGGPVALNKLGFFLRALSAVYSLADCERLLSEMIDRTDLGLPTELPLRHCQFALNDVKHVLQGAKVSPVPYAWVLGEVTNIEAKLGGGAASASAANGNAAAIAGDAAVEGTTENTKELRALIVRLQQLRNSIATTPELAAAPRPAAAPVLGTAAFGLLVLVLFAVALIELRRPAARTRPATARGEAGDSSAN